MKLGHRKRHSARATVSEVVLCGRSTVKRSVNSGRRWENPGFWEKKVQSCRRLMEITTCTEHAKKVLFLKWMVIMTL